MKNSHSAAPLLHSFKEDDFFHPPSIQILLLLIKKKLNLNLHMIGLHNQNDLNEIYQTFCRLLKHSQISKTY